MLPTNSEILYFLEVAQSENISRAAGRLGITQPTLSLAIQRLEQNLGVPLLVRGKSGVSLTRAGRAFAAKARHLVNEWENLREDTVREQSAVTGRYSLGCHPSVALYSLPQVLPDMLAAHPELEISLSHDLSRRVTDDVINFKLDFGITVNPLAHPELVIKQLGTDEVTFWIGGSPTRYQKLEDEQTVLICDPELQQTQWLLRHKTIRGFRFARTVTSGNLEVIASLVAAGVGVGILPGRVAQREEQLGLKKLRSNLPKFSDKICMVYRADAQKTAAGKAISGFLKQALR